VVSGVDLDEVPMKHPIPALWMAFKTALAHVDNSVAANFPKRQKPHQLPIMSL